MVGLLATVAFLLIAVRSPRFTLRLRRCGCALILGVFSFVSLYACAGCKTQSPPTPDASPSIALPELPEPTVPAAQPLAPSSAPIAPARSTEVAALPQTRDMPEAAGAAFASRVDAFWDAIVHDEPERAMLFFFPLTAYEQVKDVANPGADWKHRLVSAYERDIHSLHQRLGAGASTAKLVAFDVPEARARWVEPGEEWNKIGYYRVFGTKLRYSVDGEEHSFDVKSLISWRGEWFIVHLGAIG